METYISPKEKELVFNNAIKALKTERVRLEKEKEQAIRNFDQKIKVVDDRTAELRARAAANGVTLLNVSSDNFKRMIEKAKELKKSNPNLSVGEARTMAKEQMSKGEENKDSKEEKTPVKKVSSSLKTRQMNKLKESLKQIMRKQENREQNEK